MPTTSFDDAAQVAAVALLRASPDFVAAIGDRLFDQRPGVEILDAFAGPVVHVGDVFGVPALETLAGAGWRSLLTLHAVARGPGAAATATHAGALIVAALDRSEVAADAVMPSGRAVLWRVVSQNTRLTGPDEATATVRVEVLTDPA